MRLLKTSMTWMRGARRGVVALATCTLAVAGCSLEPRFPFESAKRATAIRITHADPRVRPRVREIDDPAVLQGLLEIIAQFDSWRAMPECRTGTCNDITIEWVSGQRTLIRMSLCNLGSRARVGEPGLRSPCGRSVPTGASAALLKELGEP
jgi:hypothetical protein